MEKLRGAVTDRSDECWDTRVGYADALRNWAETKIIEARTACRISGNVPLGKVVCQSGGITGWTHLNFSNLHGLRCYVDSRDGGCSRLAVIQ